ncbi:hypothetical protein VTN77DRAFT_3567 [Rasamsonia byssochlamydoides]|uniref:uncharacterized protein n=1 Tax=Rasamsonia byssochlamydoides TaxID=89139 RepID=UPI0037443CF6
MRLFLTLPVFLTAAYALNATEAEITAAQNDLENLLAAGCNVLKCVFAVASDTTSCGKAALLRGLDFFADVQCIASLGSSFENDACSGCKL